MKEGKKSMVGLNRIFLFGEKSALFGIKNTLDKLLITINIMKIYYYRRIEVKERKSLIMNIGYVRVSTVEQNERRQVEVLKKYSMDKVFTEKVSTKNIDRPELKAMIGFAREGDTIYVSSLDRLARSTKGLLNIVEELQVKGVHLVSDKENIDTSTTTGKLMITMISAIAEFERVNLLERQKEGTCRGK
ncbi:recombinase family protein [Clostridium sp. WILCCON 0269]|uniref:Recombinase family protein n=1 Tax=Candidatus Clostridium eludens TaxID=3381663 RepID=A0ABW8SJI1_9CLOT